MFVLYFHFSPMMMKKNERKRTKGMKRTAQDERKNFFCHKIDFIPQFSFAVSPAVQSFTILIAFNDSKSSHFKLHDFSLASNFATKFPVSLFFYFYFSSKWEQKIFTSERDETPTRSQSIKASSQCFTSSRNIQHNVLPPETMFKFSLFMFFFFPPVAAWARRKCFPKKACGRENVVKVFSLCKRRQAICLIKS